MPPLNPRLYEALKREFGHVKISNEGIPMSADYLPGLNGRPRLTPRYSGEYYVVACPFCHDTKGHLYINHRWGVRDPQNGTRNLWLAKCFLSDCMSDWDNCEDLAERLDDYDLQARVGVVTVPDVTEAPKRLVTCGLPRDFELLSELPRSHRAQRYVRSRGYSPKELCRVWGVGFSSDEYRDDLGRLVIPLRAYLDDPDNPEETAEGDNPPDPWDVVGYQGRYLGDPPENVPKYLTSTGTPKSRLLYGLDRVPTADTGPVIICEGPTDVWRAGPGAVALLGKDISETQCKLVRTLLPGRDVVVMLDPEAYQEGLAVAERLRAVLARDLFARGEPGRVVVARLPDERDPGDCTREEIWQAARRALACGKKRKRT